MVKENLDSLNYPHAKDFLLALLERGKVPASTLRDVIKTYATIKKLIELCEKDGLVKSEETVEGRRVLYVWLTERGRAIAEKLKEAEKISKIPPEELEKYKRIHVLQHFNVYEDHITLTDISLEGVRYVNIFAKPKGDLLYFWCDVHDDNDCYHIGYLFVDEKLRNFIKEQLNKNGYKLAKKYEKYVEKYW